VTQPVVNSTSAWRGEGSSFTPKRSTSYFGVSKATISMSHPLQAPELKCKTHGDFTRAHVIVFGISLYLLLKEPSLRLQQACDISPLMLLLLNIKAASRAELNLHLLYSRAVL
jgi:hypothetical protein